MDYNAYKIVCKSTLVAQSFTQNNYTVQIKLKNLLLSYLLRFTKYEYANVFECFSFMGFVAGAKPVSDQLHNMVQEAEKMSELLMTRILKCSTFGNLSTAELKELEKEFNMWEKRYKRLKKMKSSYSQIRKCFLFFMFFYL